jgi:hypothetical protein
MAKFVVFHTLSTPTPISEGEPFAKVVKKYSIPGANWVGSWIQLDERGNATKLCCEWDGKDKESIKRVLDRVLLEIPGVPTDGIYPLMKVDSEAYR